MTSSQTLDRRKTLDLLLRLSKRDIDARFKGSLLGSFWLIVVPLLSLGLYTFVFTTIFSSRWPGVETKSRFALILFVGLIIHAVMSESLQRAPALILENSSYVKKVIFPLQVLPIASLLSTVSMAGFSAVVLLVFYVFIIGLPPPTTILVPLVLIPYLLILAGLSYVLSAAGVFVRDLRQIMPVITQMLMFFGPVFYPLAAMPAAIRPLLYLNPVTVPIEATRSLLFDGQVTNPGALVAYWFVAIAVACVGYASFRKARRAFADVI